MSEDEIIAALAVLTWNLRTDQTFADKLRRHNDRTREAHVREVGRLYRAMLHDAQHQEGRLKSNGHDVVVAGGPAMPNLTPARRT
jgi:hypothetical protein